MLSLQKIEMYRRMTPQERWKEVEELMTLAWRSLLELPAEERRRRLDLIRREHAESNDRIVEHLRRFA